MAFTEDEQLSISDIVEVTPDDISLRLMLLGDRLTPAVEDKVRGLIAQWPSVSGSYASFTPTESNKGFNLSGGAARDAIRNSIKRWLSFPDDAGSGYQIAIERG